MPFVIGIFPPHKTQKPYACCHGISDAIRGISITVGSSLSSVANFAKTLKLLVMDATKKPLLIPPEFSTYAEKHEIFQIFEVLK